MNQLLRLTFASFILWFCTPVCREALATESLLGGFELSAGANFLHHDYVEDIALPQKSSESAWISEWTASLGFAPEHSSFSTRIKTSFSNSNTRFVGTAVDPSNPSQVAEVQANTKNQVVDLQAEIGFHILRTQALRVDFFSGLGHHAWLRNVGYRENYSWYRLPIGLDTKWAINDRVTLGFRSTFEYSFSSNIIIRRSDTISNWQDSSLTLGSRPGFEIAAPVTFLLFQGLKLSVGPSVRFSALGGSSYSPQLLVDGTSATDSQGRALLIREPASRTYQIGFEAFLLLAL